MEELYALLLELNLHRDLCRFLRYFSHSTWHRIEFARNRPGMRIYETTITQNFIYEARLASEIFGFQVDIYEAVNEPAHGNDIELFIETGDNYIFAPTQAKIIYSNYRYPRLDHGNQINDLIAYAQRYQGVPLYLFYNYYPGPDFVVNQNLCGYPVTREQYGCTFVEAEYIKNTYENARRNKYGNLAWEIPRFLDLHPDFALPLFSIGCCFPNKPFEHAIDDFYKKDFNELGGFDKFKKYTSDEIKQSDLWVPLGKKDIRIQKQNHQQDSFNPKFRLVIGKGTSKRKDKN